LKHPLTSNKVTYLEGLRGGAALIVLFSHLRMAFWVDADKALLSYFQDFLSPTWAKYSTIACSAFTAGDLSVTIFWTLSAYVLFIKFFSADSIGEGVLFASVFKRAVRLFVPCLASVLFAYLLLKFGLMHHLELANVLGKTYQEGWLGSFYLFPANLLLAIKSAVWETFFYFSLKTTYNNVLWTITNEWFGSLFLLALFGVIGKHPKRYFMYLICLFLAALLQMAWQLCFLLGYLLCDWDHAVLPSPLDKIRNWMDNTLKRMQWATIPTFIALFLWGKHFWVTWALPKLFPNTLISFLLLFLLTRTPVLKYFFSSKVMVWLGKISFGLYLVHIPILFSFSAWLYLQLGSGTHVEKTAACCLITLPLCLLVAHLFTVVIDRLALRWASRTYSFFQPKK